MLQAQAGSQRGTQQPTPQRGTTVTCLASSLNLQTQGRQREGEREATKAHVKEHKACAHPGSLIDGCREWERQWER